MEQQTANRFTENDIWPRDLMDGLSAEVEAIRQWLAASKNRFMQAMCLACSGKVIEERLSLDNQLWLMNLLFDRWKEAGPHFQSFMADNKLISRMWVASFNKGGS